MKVDFEIVWMILTTDAPESWKDKQQIMYKTALKMQTLPIASTSKEGES